LVGFRDVFGDTCGLEGVLDWIGAEVFAIVAHENLRVSRVGSCVLEDAVEDQIVGRVRN
jgi:hypothetical protein